MKKAGDNVVERVKGALECVENWRYQPDELWNIEGRFEVKRDGNVFSYSLGFIPLDWTQRRSVRRAFAKAHKRMTDKLIEAEKKALAAQGAK